MGEEIAFTEQNMNAFSEQITSAGIDVHVILVSGQKDGLPPIPHLDGVCIGAPLGSGSCPADTNAPGYAHIVQPLNDGDMLQQYINAYPMYKQYLQRMVTRHASSCTSMLTPSASSDMNFWSELIDWRRSGAW